MVLEVFRQVAPWHYTIPEKYDQGMAYLEKFKAELSASNSIRSSEFCERLANFFTIVPDNHSYFVFKKKECGISSPHPEYEGKVGLNSVQRKDLPWSWESIEIEKKKGLLLSILRFPRLTDDVWNPIKTQFSEKLRSSEFLIIDLRGNRGGDNDTALYISTLLWGGKIPTREKRYQLNSPLAFILRANDERKNSNESGYLNYLQMADRLKSPDPAYLIDKTQFEKPFEISALTSQDRIYGKPVLILSDRENGSAGEEMIMALKHHPHVKILGENSKGIFHFGNAGFFQLPYSGIEVHSSTYYNKIIGNDFVEKIGFAPQLHIHQDPLLWIKKNPKIAFSIP